MGCGAPGKEKMLSDAYCRHELQKQDPVWQAKTGEEARVAPLLLRMENISHLYKDGLMSHTEFETYRSALAAEIAGAEVDPQPMPSPIKPLRVSTGPSSAKANRLKKADEVRHYVDQLEKLMKSNPNKLPDEYYALLESLPNKFTKEVDEQDEWGNAGSGPMQEYYNSIAGRTVDAILRDQNTVLDAHQNPMGSQYDLPRDGTMGEHNLVICWFSEHGTYGKPVEALRSKGFKVVVHNSQRSTVQQMMVSFLNADVVWLVSGPKIVEGGFDQLVNALESFHRRGGGIFLWTDNDPYFAHANQVLLRLLPGEDICMEGNDRGEQIMKVHTDGHSPGKLTKSHLIMTGLNSLYEGVTVSHLSRLGPLKVLATYNNGSGYSGKPYCAVADAEVYRKCKAPNKVGRGRLVIDGGFTKLYDECWSKTAGTERYVKNASAWLLNMNSRIASEGPVSPTSAPRQDSQAEQSFMLPRAPEHAEFIDYLKVRNGVKSYRAQ